MNPGEELRSGASTSTHAFILGSFPFGETDKIVHLLTRDAGYVHGLARRAARSQKRFGASLETFSHVVAHLKVPRDFERNADKLWTLESCELRDPFLHLRKSYELMDSAFFVVQVLLEILPLRDPSLSPFVMLGRLLRDSEMLSNSPRSAWIRPFVLSWVGEAAGFGNIFEPLEQNFFGRLPRQVLDTWHHAVRAKEPNLKPLFQTLLVPQAPDWKMENDRELYESWVNHTGMTLKFFEQRSRKA